MYIRSGSFSFGVLGVGKGKVVGVSKHQYQ